MKILIIQPWIRLGGAELISIHLAHELNRKGHEVAIAASFVDLKGTPDSASGLTYLAPPRLLSTLCKRNRYLFLLLSPGILLWLTLKHSKHVDVLNPHNFPAIWVAAIVGAIRKLPVVWTCNEPPESIALGEARTVGIGDYFGWLFASGKLDRWLARRSAAIYVPSNMTQIEVMQRYGRESQIVRLGVGKPISNPVADSAMLSALEIEDSFVLLSVGKLHPQKNHLVCIEAVRLLQASIPNITLLIAGEGPFKDELQRSAANLGVEQKIQFLGHLDESALQAVYRITDVNMFPAINQSWGLTPFEALNFGRISIVSNKCGASELLGEHDIGIVCEPKASEFASRVLNVYRDPSKSQQMAIRGREYVQHVLTWASYAKNVERILSQTLKSFTDPAQEELHTRVVPR